jgi:hypothetical protein
VPPCNPERRVRPRSIWQSDFLLRRSVHDTDLTPGTPIITNWGPKAKVVPKGTPKAHPEEEGQLKWRAAPCATRYRQGAFRSSRQIATALLTCVAETPAGKHVTGRCRADRIQQSSAAGQGESTGLTASFLLASTSQNGLHAHVITRRQTPSYSVPSSTGRDRHNEPKMNTTVRRGSDPDCYKQHINNGERQ